MGSNLNDEFVLINNCVWKEYDDKKGSVNQIFQSIYKTLSLYGLKFGKKQQIKSEKFKRIKSRRILFSWNCAVCGSRKFKFIK